MYVCTVCLAGYLSVTNYRKIKETRLKKKKKKKKKKKRISQECSYFIEFVKWVEEKR